MLTSLLVEEKISHWQLLRESLSSLRVSICWEFWRVMSFESFKIFFRVSKSWVCEVCNPIEACAKSWYAYRSLNHIYIAFGANTLSLTVFPKNSIAVICSCHVLQQRQFGNTFRVWTEDVIHADGRYDAPARWWRFHASGSSAGLRSGHGDRWYDVGCGHAAFGTKGCRAQGELILRVSFCILLIWNFYAFLRASFWESKAANQEDGQGNEDASSSHANAANSAADASSSANAVNEPAANEPASKTKKKKNKKNKAKGKARPSKSSWVRALGEPPLLGAWKILSVFESVFEAKNGCANRAWRVFLVSTYSHGCLFDLSVFWELWEFRENLLGQFSGKLRESFESLT